MINHFATVKCINVNCCANWGIIPVSSTNSAENASPTVAISLPFTPCFSATIKASLKRTVFSRLFTYALWRQRKNTESRVPVHCLSLFIRWNPRLGLDLINNATAMQSSRLTNQLKPITGPCSFSSSCVFIQLCQLRVGEADLAVVCAGESESRRVKRRHCAGGNAWARKFHECAFHPHPHNPLTCFGGVWFGRALVTYRHLPTGAVMESRPLSGALPNRPQECRLSWGECVCESWQCQKARGITTDWWSKLNSKPPLSTSLSLTYASQTMLQVLFLQFSMFCVPRRPERLTVYLHLCVWQTLWLTMHFFFMHFLGIAMALQELCSTVRATGKNCQNLQYRFVLTAYCALHTA